MMIYFYDYKILLNLQTSPNHRKYHLILSVIITHLICDIISSNIDIANDYEIH